MLREALLFSLLLMLPEIKVASEEDLDSNESTQEWGLEFLYKAIQSLYVDYTDDGKPSKKTYVVDIDTGTTKYQEEVTFYYEDQTVVRKGPNGVAIEDHENQCYVNCPTDEGSCYVFDPKDLQTFDEEEAETQEIVAKQESAQVKQYVHATVDEPITEDNTLVYCSPGVINIISNTGFKSTTITMTSTMKRNVEDKTITLHQGLLGIIIHLNAETVE